MYKIQSVYRYSEDQLYPGGKLYQGGELKELIINQMLVEVAKEMHKNKSFDITEADVPDALNRMLPETKEIRISGFVMRYDELKTIVKLLTYIRSLVPYDKTEAVDRLYEMLTEHSVEG